MAQLDPLLVLDLLDRFQLLSKAGFLGWELNDAHPVLVVSRDHSRISFLLELR